MSKNGWALEVVRGSEVGRVFPLEPGASVLGNAPGGGPAVDLGPQEGASPRRMAARQAQVVCSPDGLSLADLDSPGGTFVNRQRLLPGQDRRLNPGDVIQVGGVQLRVVARPATANGKPPEPVAVPPPAKVLPRPPENTVPSPKPTATTPPVPVPERAAVPASPKPRTGPPSAPFRLASGAVCRGWDDFLTVSAQKWSDLRDEMESGRLPAYLTTVGREDLAPRPGPDSDERLDEWLGRLPTTRPATPDFEVHPDVIRVRAVAGGGTTRRTIVLTNTGYRLLRTSVRVEDDPLGLAKVAPGFTSGSFTTTDQTEIPVDVTIPESFRKLPKARVVFEGNGGRKAVEIQLIAAPEPQRWEEPSGQSRRGPVGVGPVAWFAGLPGERRVGIAALAAGGLRAFVLAGDLVGRPAAGSHSLEGTGLVLGFASALAAAVLAIRKGETGSVPAAAFAGGLGGSFLAAVGVALANGFEPASNVPGIIWPLAWGLLGGGAGWLVRRTAAKKGASP